jgi:hypothetical protein
MPLMARSEELIDAVMDSRRRRFSVLGWVLNTHFWSDPTNDVAGILMTQLLPFLDEKFMALYADLKRAVYANLDQLKDAVRP